MKGKIVSYVLSKKFGFIEGEDGESYFLHMSALVDKSAEIKLLKGVVIEFEPCPTPKGLSAKKVSVLEVFISENLVNYFVSRDIAPKHGHVVLRLPIDTRFFKDPTEGRQHIEELAKKCGCNAVLGMGFEKKTFSEGNYQYTVHSFKGHLALVTEKVPCDSRAFSELADQHLHHRVESVKSAFERINAEEIRVRQSQLSVGSGGCLGFFAFMMLLPIGLVSGIFNFFPS